MRRVFMFFTGFFALLLLGSGTPNDSDDGTESVSIEGTWQQTALERDGQKELSSSKTLLVVHGGSLTYIYSDGEKVKGSYHIDSSHKYLYLDWLPTNGTDRDQMTFFIYQIHGDTLRIAGIIGEYRTKRPHAFIDDGVFVKTFKRVK